MSDLNSVCGIPLREALPDGWMAVDAVVCLRALDPEGNARVVTRATPGLQVVEAVGMIELARQRLLKALDGPEDRS